MKRNNKKGFTIVELVIVIAVIAILSAVLIPTFGGVIADAQATSAKQEARNGYVKCYADDIKDGKQDGQTLTTADSNYNNTQINGTWTYSVTGADSKVYSFDGEFFYIDGAKQTN